MIIVMGNDAEFIRLVNRIKVFQPGCDEGIDQAGLILWKSFSWLSGISLVRFLDKSSSIM